MAVVCVAVALLAFGARGAPADLRDGGAGHARLADACLACTQTDGMGVAGARDECSTRTPQDIHYYVINMDISTKRMVRFRERFEATGLHQLERVPGVLVRDGEAYEVPRGSSVARADFGVALAHREVWRRLSNSSHEWAIVFEDDAVPASKWAITEFPPIPDRCDFVQLSTGTSYQNENLCGRGDMLKIGKGWSTAAYLLHRDAAARLLQGTARGFHEPVDLVMIYQHTGCITTTSRADVPVRPANDPQSVRDYLNGNVNNHNDLVMRRRSSQAS